MEELKFEKSIDLMILYDMIGSNTTLESLIGEYPESKPIELQKVLDRLEKQYYIFKLEHRYKYDLPRYRIKNEIAFTLNTLRRLYPEIAELSVKGDYKGVMKISEAYINYNG